MSLAAKILATAGRPDAEADRVIAAVNAANDSGVEISGAIDRANAEIADAKRPRRQAPAPEHLAGLVDEPDDSGGGFDDIDPLARPRTDPAYLLTDDPEPQPEPESEPVRPPRRSPWECDAAPEPEYLPLPPPEYATDTEDDGPGLLDRLRERLESHRPTRRAVAWSVGGVVLAFIVVVSFTLSGRGEPPPQPAGQVGDAPSQTDAPPPEAPKDMILVPATVSASCGNDSDAVAPFSNDRTRAWRCQRLNGLDLNVLNMTFSCPVVITSITVVPGFAYVAPDGRDEWVRNRVAVAVSFRMGGAIYEMKMPNPTRTGITQQFPNVITEVMSMTITASIRPPVQSKGTDQFGSKADEESKVDEFSAISKIVIKGHPVDPSSGLCGSVGNTARGTA